jgi:O-antigen/teichoic acid export membrane protein
MELRGLDQTVQAETLQAMLRRGFFLLFIVSIVFLGVELSASLGVGAHIAACTVALGTFQLRRSLPFEVRQSEACYEVSPWIWGALPLLLVRILQVANMYTDILMLGGIKGANDVGFYKVAAQTAALVPFGLHAVNRAVAPTISRLYTSDDKESLQAVVTRATQAASILAIPAAAVFLIFGGQILPWVFGREFGRGGVALAILSIGHLSDVVFGPVGLTLIMTGHERLVTKGTALISVSNLVLNGALIPFFGIEGAAVATTSSMLVGNMILAIWVYKKIGIKTVLHI